MLSHFGASFIFRVVLCLFFFSNLLKLTNTPARPPWKAPSYCEREERTHAHVSPAIKVLGKIPQKKKYNSIGWTLRWASVSFNSDAIYLILRWKRRSGKVFWGWWREKGADCTYAEFSHTCDLTWNTFFCHHAPLKQKAYHKENKYCLQNPTEYNKREEKVSIIVINCDAKCNHRSYSNRAICRICNSE